MGKKLGGISLYFKVLACQCILRELGKLSEYLVNRTGFETDISEICLCSFILLVTEFMHLMKIYIRICSVDWALSTEMKNTVIRVLWTPCILGQ
jgi:hypothetical protein